ncbi:hypothetical protein GPALN_004906 [Globodera pallida]|nr:hypothetical protein GPALN_004906 [Globodera pallida]
MELELESIKWMKEEMKEIMKQLKDELKDVKQLKEEMEGMKQYMEEMKQSMEEMHELHKIECEKYTLQTKIVELGQKQQKSVHEKMGTNQKKQQQSIDQLQKSFAKLSDGQKENVDQFRLKMDNLGLIPQNKWEPVVSHKDLALFGTERLIAQHTGIAPANRSLLAEWPIPKNHFGIFFFEVNIVKKQKHLAGIAIGLAPKQIPLGDFVGCYEGTYAYQSNGTFWGHDVEGCSNDGRPCINGKPAFEEGDVIGCGVNLATRQIIYTKNGQRLDTTNMFVTYADLHPCVTLYHTDDKIEANFGPNFKYDISPTI